MVVKSGELCLQSKRFYLGCRRLVGRLVFISALRGNPW
jgi:hypothetical protein